MGKHAVDRYLDFVRYLAGSGPDDGKSGCMASAPEFTIVIGEEEQRRVAALLREQEEILNTANQGGEGTGIRREGNRGRTFCRRQPCGFLGDETLGG